MAGTPGRKIALRFERVSAIQAGTPRDRSRKAIPNGDREFLAVARRFAGTIAPDPAKYALSAEDAQAIARGAQAFEDALSAIAGEKGSQLRTREKNQARAAAKAIIRKYRDRIRGNDQISDTDKQFAGVAVRPKRLRKSACPKSPPYLRFVGSKHGYGATGKVHVLAFQDKFASPSCAKPAGAARLELFVELVAQGEPVPQHPGELSAGRAWYLRSFTRSPMEVEFPMPSSPMLVVYWARWADSTGKTGPFSKTVTAEVEGWETSRTALPDQTEVRRRQQKIVITSARLELPDCDASVEAIEEDTRRLLTATGT